MKKFHVSSTFASSPGSTVKVIWFGFKISNLVILMNKYQRPQKFFNEIFVKNALGQKIVTIDISF